MTIKSNISDDVIVSLFRKYEESIFSTFKEVIEQTGEYQNTDELDLEGIIDELFCGLTSRKISGLILESIEDSIGLNEYGVLLQEDSD